MFVVTTAVCHPARLCAVKTVAYQVINAATTITVAWMVMNAATAPVARQVFPAAVAPVVHQIIPVAKAPVFNRPIKMGIIIISSVAPMQMTAMGYHTQIINWSSYLRLVAQP